MKKNEDNFTKIKKNNDTELLEMKKNIDSLLENCT